MAWSLHLGFGHLSRRSRRSSGRLSERAGRSVGRWRLAPCLMSQVWSNVRTSKWRIRSGGCYTNYPLGISDICPAGSEV